MVFRTWWAAGSWGPGESWPQILCRPLRLDSRRRSPEGAGLSGSSLRWVLDKHPTVAWNFVSAAGSDWAGYLVVVLCRTCAREVSSEDARSGRISATDKRYGHQLPIVYPSVRANEVVSVLRPLIVHHAG